MPSNRKRQRSHETLPDGRPTKFQRPDHSLPNEHCTQRPRRDPATDDNSSRDHHRAWRYLPEFWDRLSTVPLVRNALRELDRRNRIQHPLLPSPPASTGYAPDSTRTLTPASARRLARFARHGGPDLRGLRGYPAPASIPKEVLSMSAMSSSQNRVTKSTGPRIGTKSETTKKKKLISAYDGAFAQHLTDFGIHTVLKSKKPERLEELETALRVPRPSLSPSRFPDGAFEMFVEKNTEAEDENDVIAKSIPVIAGDEKANYLSTRNTQFNNLDPLTDGSLVKLKPDISDGAVPGQLDSAVRHELSRCIVPTTAGTRPIVPNFFVEVKGPDGSPRVLLQQARYAGAIGARAMNRLQNYGQEEPVYDGKSYALTCTYHHDGILKLYAHHTTAPATEGGRPEYHMTLLNGYYVTSNREAFVQGVTLFRNARDLAEKYRNDFIQAANSRIDDERSAAHGNLAVSTEHDSSSDTIGRHQTE